MGIKTFNVMALGKANLLNPEQIGYRDSIDIIRDELQRTKRSFVKIGWYLKHIENKKMFQEEGYANIYEFAADKFNLSQPTATRFMQICEQFSVDHNSPDLDEKYGDFSVSQLFEMLPMKQEDIDQVTPDMKVTEIRAFKKKNKDSKTCNEPSNADVRAFYKKHLAVHNLSSENLLSYLIDHYGKTHAGGGDGSISFKCSLRGITLNQADEITWKSFVKRINGLCLIAEKNDDDSEEAMPDNCQVQNQNISDSDIGNYAISHINQNSDSGMIIDGEYREIKETHSNQNRIDLQKEEKTIRNTTFSGIDFLKTILEQEKETLDEYYKVGGMPENTVNRQKMIVTALAAMLCNLDKSVFNTDSYFNWSPSFEINELIEYLKDIQMD